jgi:hypothetical protein
MTSKKSEPGKKQKTTDRKKSFLFKLQGARGRGVQKQHLNILLIVNCKKKHGKNFLLFIKQNQKNMYCFRTIFGFSIALIFFLLLVIALAKGSSEFKNRGMLSLFFPCLPAPWFSSLDQCWGMLWWSVLPR